MSRGSDTNKLGTATQQPPADGSLAPVPDELFAAEFMAWWEEHGQLCKSGGGEYERTFAFEAWRYLYPQLMSLRTALAEQQPDVTQLAEALLKARSAVATLAGIRGDGVHEGDEEHARELYALLAEIDDLATYRKGGEA